MDLRGKQLSLRQHGIPVCQRRRLRPETGPLVHTPCLRISRSKKGSLNTTAKSYLGSSGGDRRGDAESPECRQGGYAGQFCQAIQWRRARGNAREPAVQAGQERQPTPPHRVPQILAVIFGDLLGHPVTKALTLYNHEVLQVGTGTVYGQLGDCQAMHSRGRSEALRIANEQWVTTLLDKTGRNQYICQIGRKLFDVLEAGDTLVR